MYNDERQLGAMLTLETSRIFPIVNSAKSVGWISFRQGNPYQAMQVLKINELQRMGLEAGWGGEKNL
ncbi:MAG: hypothetical protein B6247_13525 [Candidatus Parabeggiatoa sp. nov. 2]|nr:MAG: hypothetical protein B6247_13525 [Beggiatoa sp. 4572_84]